LLFLHPAARTNMMMRFSKVTPEGSYVPPPPANSKASYATMLFVRADIVRNSGGVLSKAVTIATRYAAVRRQTAPGPGQCMWLFFSWGCFLLMVPLWLAWLDIAWQLNCDAQRSSAPPNFVRLKCAACCGCCNAWLPVHRSSLPSALWVMQSSLIIQNGEIYT
jgi:hypothetical protein